MTGVQTCALPIYAIPEPVYIINPNFQIKFVNRVLSERLGISKEECLDKISYSFIRGLPEDKIPEDGITLM